MNYDNKIAVLIDGDNAESALIEQILTEAGKNGRTTIRRIYADWTDNRMSKWKNHLNKYAIKPEQKFAYAYGKNSTDTALIIDAMDILHSKVVDGFCIVSSDSDYTGLAHRIREHGLIVMGIGKGHTPEAFVKACDSFTYTEIFKTEVVKKEKNNLDPKEDSEIIVLNTQKESEINVVEKIDLNLIGSLKKSGVKSINLSDIEAAFNMIVDVNTGLAFLSRFSEALRRIDPTFDNRNFGYSSFRKFCESLSPNYITVLHEDNVTISLKKKE
jgi:uncharacterized LabA/DUF88 family protein